MKAQGTSLNERITHAVGYEALLILIVTPTLAWVLDKPAERAGALALSLALIAMLWNMAYNAIVDRYIQRERIHWSFGGRVMHGLGFEAGMVLICVPVAAWMLGISLLQAFLVELGFLAFILPYTVAYNWAFDKARYRLRRGQNATV